MSEFDFKIMITGERSEFYFLCLRRMLCFFLLNFFALLVFKLAIVHQAAHWRIDIWRNLNEIKALLKGDLKRPARVQYAQLVAFSVNNPDFRRLD
jgi:hypothetical protein